MAGSVVRQGLCAIGGPLVPAGPHLVHCLQATPELAEAVEDLLKANARPAS
jgi:hypothetical protein